LLNDKCSFPDRNENVVFSTINLRSEMLARVVMRGLSTATQISFFSADDAGVTVEQAESNEVR
jgi:hypothetical protein